MKKLDIIIAFWLALLSYQAYAEDGNPPPDIESEVSETDTSFVGARILQEGEEVWGGEPYLGIYEDDLTQSYGFWQGDTLFFGAENPDHRQHR